MKDESGGTRRDSLMQVIESAEEGNDLYESAINELENGPKIPFFLEHVWQWFWEINKGRTVGMSGPNPLTWQDLYCWQRVTNKEVRPIEFDFLREMDSAYLKYIHDQNKLRQGNKKSGRS
jgi:hypothetical protein